MTIKIILILDFVHKKVCILANTNYTLKFCLFCLFFNLTTNLIHRFLDKWFVLINPEKDEYQVDKTPCRRIHSFHHTEHIWCEV